MARDEGAEVRRRILALRQEEDDFIYDVVLAGTLEDAIIAVLFNHNVQSVVIRYSFPFSSPVRVANLRHYLTEVDLESLRAESRSSPAHALSRALAWVRPELDQFLVTDDPVRNVSAQLHKFRRVFYHQEDYLELHLSILQGIEERHETPFFSALREYSQKPTGVFHALPISRGKSLMKSHWIKDMADFYGNNIFLAETSSTSGGLDSLLQPHGPIKRAQQKAARAFGSRETYLVTNGTSTANKIVLQALLRPGDIVLVSRDCHKSHHYAIMLAGAHPVYMDPYPLPDYSFYGAVPLPSSGRSR
jgi:arginine decarboxylase